MSKATNATRDTMVMLLLSDAKVPRMVSEEIYNQISV